jgi:hypothetical protein
MPNTAANTYIKIEYTAAGIATVELAMTVRAMVIARVLL